MDEKRLQEIEAAMACVKPGYSTMEQYGVNEDTVRELLAEVRMLRESKAVTYLWNNRPLDAESQTAPDTRSGR